ncbi:hypothetical protein FP74_gp058 [Bacillus phage CAM003]|nr:hypothetical protein FP74_gp058 [Bacillus phage CAM003]AHZ09495.1 hypothetical protein [Bacillus phage CAM003]AMW61813.1 hypothetical protein DNAM5_62 [Bacillus phage Vinny]
MPEQKFCAKCGRLNWSEWSTTCYCTHPEFIYDSYEDYMKNKRVYVLTLNDNFYGSGGLPHIQQLMNYWIGEHGLKHKEFEFKVMLKERE